jgi:hypothetical protein
VYVLSVIAAVASSIGSVRGRHEAGKWVYVATLVAIILLSRLPQLLSPNMLLDGDECILGLMAKHVAEGKEFPIFFYGQSYGFSIVEAVAGALSFIVAGVGWLPLKLAMLALWTIGVVALFSAFSRLWGNRRSFWITLLLVLTPAWAVWSMKARGGYITAFSASAVLMYLLIRFKERERLLLWVAAGGLTSLIYLAQPLWLPGVIPIVIYSFVVSPRKRSFGIGYVVGIASVLGITRILSPATLADYWGPPEMRNKNLLGSLPGLLQQLYANLTGSYYLRFTFDPGPVTAITAYVWCGILVAMMLLQIYRLVTGKYLLWSHLLAMSVVLTLLASWVLLDARDARYLLPLTGFLVLLLGVELSDLIDRKILTDRKCFLGVGVLLLLGAISMIEFSKFSFMWKNPKNSLSEAKRLEAVADYLKANGATHAFSMHPLLQWQIIFYSKEQIVARWTDASDRYPAYPREVDRALNDGETVGLVGYVGTTRGLEKMVSNPQAIFTIDNRYFVYIHPDKELLKQLRFQFAQ